MAPDPSLLFLLLLVSAANLTFSLSPTTSRSNATTVTAANGTISPSAPKPISPIKAPSAPNPTAGSPKPSPATPIPLPPPSSSSSSSSTLDPKQVRALQSLSIPTSRDPCSPSSFHNSTTCDASKPFRHLISLRLSNCSDDVALSTTALKSLSTLRDLQLINCPISPIRFPSDFASNLRSFTCIRSLKKLTGVWLSRMPNLTELTVSDVTVNASGPSIILGKMKILHSVTISHSNLSGFLPKHWHLNLTHIDLSGNNLRGKIPNSLTLLDSLESLNLSSNTISGEIPSTLGDLLSLRNLSLASNSLSGSIPESLASMPELIHLDLGSNQLNGTIPKFISDMKSLKFLNLEQNNFHGVLPFNVSFMKRLTVFKVGENTNLCYNHSTTSIKLKLGIAPCDRHGLPMSPRPAKDSTAEDSDSDEDDDGSEIKQERHHSSGSSKIVLAVAIGLSSIVFLIVLLVILSKCCR